MTKKKGFEKYILAPEIKEYQDLQVFEFRGKDAHGNDFGVQLSPVEVLSLMEEVPKVDYDRVKMYLGGDPANIKDIGTELEVSMGKEKEVYKIDSASMTYIPKGMPYRQRVLKKPDKLAWVLSLTLPPQDITPDKPEK